MNLTRINVVYYPLLGNQPAPTIEMEELDKLGEGFKNDQLFCQSKINKKNNRHHNYLNNETLTRLS